jgi:hypothetical protein
MLTGRASVRGKGFNGFTPVVGVLSCLDLEPSGGRRAAPSATRRRLRANDSTTVWRRPPRTFGPTTEMNASILLTQHEPTVDPATRDVDLGWHHDGIFIVDCYPCRIEAGGVVEVRYHATDVGVHEIEVYGVLEGAEDQEHPICAPFIHEIPVYAGDFASMTQSIDTFALAATVEGDLDMLLRVDIDRTTYAQTRIAVRSTTMDGLPMTHPSDSR